LSLRPLDMSVGGCEDGGLVAQGAAVGAHEEHLGLISRRPSTTSSRPTPRARGRLQSGRLQHDLAIFCPFPRNCSWAMLVVPDFSTGSTEQMEVRS
jgi:hypothetical protein